MNKFFLVGSGQNRGFGCGIGYHNGRIYGVGFDVLAPISSESFDPGDGHGVGDGNGFITGIGFGYATPELIKRRTV